MARQKESEEMKTGQYSASGRELVVERGCRHAVAFTFRFVKIGVMVGLDWSHARDEIPAKT